MSDESSMAQPILNLKPVDGGRCCLLFLGRLSDEPSNPLGPLEKNEYFRPFFPLINLLLMSREPLFLLDIIKSFSYSSDAAVRTDSI